MKELTIYECTDGTRFDYKDKAERYEHYYQLIQEANNMYLGANSRPINPGVTWRIQHNVESVKAFRKRICELAAEYIPEWKKEFLECATGERHISHAIRLVSDYNVEMFHSNAFFRLECIDENTGYEYQQPFYAAHPDEWEKDYEKYGKI